MPLQNTASERDLWDINPSTSTVRSSKMYQVLVGGSSQRKSEQRYQTKGTQRNPSNQK